MSAARVAKTGRLTRQSRPQPANSVKTTPSLAALLAVLTASQVILAGAYNGEPGILGPVAAPSMGLAPQVLGTYVGGLSVASLLAGLPVDAVLRRYGCV